MNQAPEPEYRGSIWKHPYMVYIYLTAGIFVFLGLCGWLAYESGWIPNRGINQ